MAANLRSLEARLDNMKGDFDRRGTAFFLFAFCLLPSAIHRLTIRQSDNIQTDRRALSINSHLSSLLTFQFSFFAKLSFPFCFSLHSISLGISINIIQSPFGCGCVFQQFIFLFESPFSLPSDFSFLSQIIMHKYACNF